MSTTTLTVFCSESKRRTFCARFLHDRSLREHVVAATSSSSPITPSFAPPSTPTAARPPPARRRPSRAMPACRQPSSWPSYTCQPGSWCTPRWRGICRRRTRWECACTGSGRRDTTCLRTKSHSSCSSGEASLGYQDSMLNHTGTGTSCNRLRSGSDSLNS